MKYCRDCGAEILDNAEICPKCGCRQMNGRYSVSLEDVSDRSRLTALLLCIFLGVFGIHRFFVGEQARGLP